MTSAMQLQLKRRASARNCDDFILLQHEIKNVFLKSRKFPPMSQLEVK
jgi:hypothetical protein